MVKVAFPPATIPLVDQNGLISPDWNMGLTGLLNRTGGTSNDFVAESIHVSANGIVVATDFTTGATTTRSIASGTGISVSNGSGIAGNPTVTLANTAVSAGSYGDGTHVGAFTVDAQGRLTAASSVAISFPAALVSSVFGRTGVIVAATNDYSFSQISGSLAGSQTPAYTGDVTKSAGGTVTVLANIPAISGANLTSLNASNLGSGTVPAARLPNPSASTLGGVQSISVVSTKFLTSISTSGVPAAAQPAFTDISGTVAAAQLPLGSSSAFGAFKVDNVTVTASLGVLSASGTTSAVSTQQILTSGSGATYTTPASCRQIKIRMVGAGGGGGDSGANAGATGGTTTFNSINAIGGGGSGFSGGPGGTGGTGSATRRMTGNSGGYGGSAGTLNTGGVGGAGPWGGGGRPINASTGGSGAANSGSGGAGGGSIGNFGCGGGSGEYVEITINTPAGTYTYTIGAGGAGSAVSGTAGGAGGSGIVIVDEYY